MTMAAHLMEDELRQAKNKYASFISSLLTCTQMTSTCVLCIHRTPAFVGSGASMGKR